MSHRSQISCEKCKASYVIDVFNLGQNERDGLRCDCCGDWILPEEKRTKAYSILQTMQHGNMHPKLSQLSEYVGRKLRFSKGEERFVGVVQGQSNAVFATAYGPIHPWLVISGDTEIHIDPEDRWNICGCSEA